MTYLLLPITSGPGTTLGAQADSLGYYELRAGKGNLHPDLFAYRVQSPLNWKIFLEENVINFNFYPEHHAHGATNAIRALQQSKLPMLVIMNGRKKLLNIENNGLSMNLAS